MVISQKAGSDIWELVHSFHNTEHLTMQQKDSSFKVGELLPISNNFNKEATASCWRSVQPSDSNP